MTGHPDVENIGNLMKQGLVDYPVEPVQTEKLTSAVGKAVKGHELFKGDFSHGR